MHPGEKARAIREMQRLSGNAVAVKAGTHRANLRRFELNGVGFSTAVLMRVAGALGTTMADLMNPAPPVVVRRSEEPPSLQGIREQDDEYDFDPKYEVRLPVYDMEVSGGPGVSVPEYIETREYLTFRRSWLKKVDATEDDIKIVNVTGHSMEPRLWDDDKIAIHTGKVKVKSGRVFALSYGGEARVKRLYLLADGSLRITSDNPDKEAFPDEFVRGDELNNVIIMGQGVHKMGSGGL